MDQEYIIKNFLKFTLRNEAPLYNKLVILEIYNNNYSLLHNEKLLLFYSFSSQCVFKDVDACTLCQSQ